MIDLGRVGNSDNFNFRGIPSFLQVWKKPSQRKKKKACLHGDRSAIYL